MKTDLPPMYPRVAIAQHGLSLIEMMVGLTIGLVLTLGLFTLIANTSQSFKIQDDFSRMQENGATAFRYIGDSLRHAGFYGNVMAPSNIKISTSSAVAMNPPPADCGSAANPPSANWAFDFTTPLISFPDLTPATVSGVFPCILRQNFYAGPPLPNPNPILVTRGANGYRICNALVAAPGPPVCTNPGSLLASQPDPKNTIYVQANPYDGQIFYGGNYPTADAKKYANGNDLEMFEYRTHVYYVRPCSRPANGAVDCQGNTDDDNHPIPTLVRQELVGSSMTEVPLVEGVELIDYRFGIDTNGDGVADVFNATPITADWINVVTVKVSILVRSPGLNPAYDDSGKQYDLYGDGKTRIYKCTSMPAPACNYKRKVYSQIFQVRNVAQRKGA
jgi:type IV pilus assembly protein PilW